MANDLLLGAAALWLLAALLALSGTAGLSRVALAAGAAAGALGAVFALPDGGADVALPLGLGGTSFSLAPSAAWLLLFGLVAAVLATALGSPVRERGAAWCFGAAASLIGALGVFGLEEGVSFLVAWELMSLGGALMILSERLAPETGKPVLFMLALLEVGSVALMLAILLLARGSGSLNFSTFAAAGGALPVGVQFWIGLLLLVGFGAKIGLLPFYEWFPQAYAAGSGATGTLMSGVVLNAAFFGLARGLAQWLPVLHAPSGVMSVFDGFVVAIAVVSTVLTVLYAFQQEDWRGLLSFSSAENGSIAVALLGASLVFARDGSAELASMAWIVALLHLAGHTLAKAALFLCADGVAGVAGRYDLKQSGLLRKSSWIFGVGAIFAGMSLAAMPPQAGFVSEWYLFQTMFNGFHLHALNDRLLLVVAGAGLALTAAVALATFVKVLGIGLLGRGRDVKGRVATGHAVAVGVLGLGVLVLAAGMPVWLNALVHATPSSYGADAATSMHDGWLLVPLTAKFAFISPSKLVIAMPLLALVPLLLLVLARPRVRRSPVWYGGREQDPGRASTTALAFSNALRTFYSFIYRPEMETTREHSKNGNGHPYFVRRLTFTHSVAPIFGPILFRPIEILVNAITVKLRALQSGHLNFYLALIGLLVVAILAVALL